MKPKCRHHWTFLSSKPHGEDRVIHQYSCTHCPKVKVVNRKKPRYSTRKPLVAQSTKKQPKTRQRGPVSKRKAIRPVSDKKEAWNRKYNAKKRAEVGYVTGWGLGRDRGIPFLVRTQDTKSWFEPHHPLGRIGCRILFYVWVTPELHQYIHQYPDIAREKGWILPEMSGRTSDEAQRDPFEILEEYREYIKHHGLL